MLFYAPLVDHNPLHFLFVETICAITYSLDKETILYQLLEPHTRFTTVLHNGAVLGGFLTSNEDGYLSKYTKPFEVFPCTLKSINEFSSLVTNDKYNKDSIKEFFYQPSLNKKIPYLKALSEYYQEVENFVKKLVKKDQDNLSNIKSSLQNQMDDLKESLVKYMHLEEHSLDDVDSVNIISRFIYQVSIEHSATHFSVLRRFQGLEYNVKKDMMPKISPFLITKDLKDCNKYTKPEDIVDQNYAQRMKGFFDIAVRFNHNPNKDLDFTMENIKYNLPIEFGDCVASFQKNLIGLAEHNPDFCPLYEMSQSIAF
jgi:hypothetical protein